ncbi:MAG: membrane protein insertase YidC [Nitrospiraceae bacterium]|nr:membrane protein insertase YidC [Nitrospiraceae bacterium]
MDDNRDNEMKRNQIIFVVLMTVMVVAWFKWFAPKPQPPTPVPVNTQQTTQERPAQPSAPDTLSAVPEPVPASTAPTAAQLLGLPEKAVVDDPAAEEVIIESDSLELVFTRIGARLKQAYAIVGEDQNDRIALIPESASPDTAALYPFGLRFPTKDDLGDELDWRRFDVERDPSGQALTFTLELDGQALIRKRFAIGERRHVLRVEIEYENLGQTPRIVGLDQTPAYYLKWEPNLKSLLKKSRFSRQELVWRKDRMIDQLATAKMKPKDGYAYSQTVPSPEWFAIKNQYFLAAFRPDYEGANVRTTGNPDRYRVAVSVPRFVSEPGSVHLNGFDVYLGPGEQNALANGWDTLPAVLRFFKWRWMDLFAKFLLRILNFFYHNIIGNYGLAIIFLTVVVRMSMYPLTLKSMRSMKKMQLLGPEIEKLKADLGDEPQEMNKRMMELYKERGVNPLGGCLPMLLQMPVFITLYRMLWNAYELRGAHFFLWINDLSTPDKLFHMPWMRGVPFVGETFEYFNLLPILMGLAMVLNSKLMPTTAAAQNQQQKTMMTIMPVFFSFICYNMAAGLNLYILTSTVLGMVQQHFTRVSDVDVKPKKVKTAAKKQHFYVAAQARKRRLDKEAKKAKRRKP